LIRSLTIEDLHLPDYEDPPTEALDALASDACWVDWACELLPEMVDLKDGYVSRGYFGDWGTAGGLIWDLLDAVLARKGVPEEFKDRAFEFVIRCLRSSDEEVYNPASIGFVCKVAKVAEREVKATSLRDVLERADDLCGKHISIEELAARLPLDLIQTYEELLKWHYGKSAYDRMIAVKSGKGRH
jgi:hypothetical protein